MNAREFHAMADRCRDLSRTTGNDEVRDQLRQWASDFDAEAEAIVKARDYSATDK